MTETLPATKPFIPQLPWYLEQEGVTEEILSDIERARPKVIVTSNIPGKITDFINKNYTIVNSIESVGILEIK